MNTTLFLAPLRLEARALRRGAPDAEIERIGMGPVRATAAYARIATREQACRPILLAGVAGALTDELSPGSIVVANAIVATGDEEVVELDNGEEIAAVLEHDGLSVTTGTVLSSPSIVSGKDRAEAANRGALVVEMEARWCAALARQHHFGVVRVVLDVPGRELWSPATALAARRAHRSLVAVARALCAWSPAPVRSRSFEEVGEP